MNSGSNSDVQEQWSEGQETESTDVIICPIIITSCTVKVFESTLNSNLHLKNQIKFNHETLQHLHPDIKGHLTSVMWVDAGRPVRRCDAQNSAALLYFVTFFVQNTTSNGKARSRLAVVQQLIIRVPQSCKTLPTTAPLYIGARTAVVDPCILYGRHCILFHNYPILLRNRHGVFDHSVMILEVHQGLAASSLSPTLLQGYSQDVLTKSDGWCLSFSHSYFCPCHTNTNKKSDSPVISEDVMFGTDLIETGGRLGGFGGSRKLMTERMKNAT